MFERLKDNYPIMRINDEVRKGKVNRELISEKKSFVGKVYEIIFLFVNSCIDTNITGISAQMAFIVLMALLPTLFLIFLVCSRIIPDFDVYFYGIIHNAIPEASSQYLTDEFNILINYLNSYRILMVIICTLMGTLSAHTIVIGLNQTYGFGPYKSRKWVWIKSFFMLLSLIIILVAALYFFFISTFTIEIFNNTINIKLQENIVIDISSLISGLAALFLILLGIYMFTPYRRISIREAYPGAVFALISILIVFQIYLKILNRSLNYLRIYGTMSGLFILLTALFFLCLVINLGVKVNVFFAKKTQFK